MYASGRVLSQLYKLHEGDARGKAMLRLDNGNCIRIYLFNDGITAENCEARLLDQLVKYWNGLTKDRAKKVAARVTATQQLRYNFKKLRIAAATVRRKVV